MIEKKTMGYADFGYPQYEAKAVTVMADTESGKVMIYNAGEDGYADWREPNDQEHFYPTVDEARKALDEHRRHLRDMMPKVRQMIEQMDELLDKREPMPKDADEDEWRKEHPEWFSREDYLPYRYAHEGESTYDSRRAARLDKENDMLIWALRTGMLNIRADQVRISDVESVKWGDDCAQIVLKGGREIKTVGDFDLNVVRYIFGGNASGYTYTRLKRDEDGSEE